MNRDYKFTIGQKVKMYDKEDQTMAYGEVVDTTRDTVFIKWDDLSEPCEHERFEFEDIKTVAF